MSIIVSMHAVNIVSTRHVTEKTESAHTDVQKIKHVNLVYFTISLANMIKHREGLIINFLYMV